MDIFYIMPVLCLAKRLLFHFVRWNWFYRHVITMKSVNWINQSNDWEDEHSLCYLLPSIKLISLSFWRWLLLLWFYLFSAEFKDCGECVCAQHIYCTHFKRSIHSPFWSVKSSGVVLITRCRLGSRISYVRLIIIIIRTANAYWL